MSNSWGTDGSQSPWFGKPKPDETVHKVSSLSIEEYVSGINSLTISESQRVQSTIRNIAGLLPYASNSFGLELRTQLYIEEAQADTGRKVFFRLCQEPLIMSNLSTFGDPATLASRSLDLASLLCGRPIKKRYEVMWARGPKGHFVYFESRSQSESWLEDINTYLESDLPILVKAALCHHRVVAAHPFSDGNGRFSRALITGVLARYELTNAPCLPLGPVFKLRNEKLARAVIKLTQDGNLSAYMECFISLIEEAIHYATIDRFRQLGSSDNAAADFC